ARIDEDARADQAIDRRLPGRSRLLVRQSVDRDQSPRAPDLVHDGIARVDAQAAAYAFELLAVADVDSGRTDRHALAAVHAVAAAFPALPGLVLAARLATPALVRDDQRVLVEHRRLEARPRAHIGAD